MRSILIVFLMLLPGLNGNAASAAPPEAACKPFGSDRNLFPYRFESGDRHYADLLTLESGARYSGKVLEWADEILLYDAAGHVTVYPLSEVALFETRRSDRLKAKPDLPDLTVAYVERGPRSIWRKHVVTEDGLSKLNVDPQSLPRSPKAGDKADFRVHILNAGAKASSPVPCRVQIDGKDVAGLTLPSLKPGAERPIEFSWTWQEGPHTLRVEIDPDGKMPEIARWNNTFVEPIRALAVGVIVSRDRYEAFRSTPNMVDTFCIEDTIQYHLRNLNALFAASVYPSTPQGVLERVRCDSITVVDDPAKWRNIRAELLSKYDAALVLGPVSKDENIPIDALKVDWRLLQQVGSDIGLADPHRTDTTLQQCYVHDKFGRYAQRRHLSPWIRT
ncbi:MAG: CARDB domain-containing protein, partial [Phycisphaerae bacterium]